jgi:hypothetical protein
MTVDPYLTRRWASSSSPMNCSAALVLQPQLVEFVLDGRLEIDLRAVDGSCNAGNATIADAADRCRPIVDIVQEMGRIDISGRIPRPMCSWSHVSPVCV